MLPNATPYFDVIRMKKTPSAKVIPHLVVQCGEKHVTPVSQALLNFLTGKGTAVFIPRHALGSMTDLQVEMKFDNHQKWSRSLTALSLSPFVSHLDQDRNEYYPDGTVMTRSTRDWVASLKMADGTPALCDAVNGTSDQKAALLTPAPYLEKAKMELQQYELRISPLVTEKHASETKFHLFPMSSIFRRQSNQMPHLLIIYSLQMSGTGTRQQWRNRVILDAGKK